MNSHILIDNKNTSLLSGDLRSLLLKYTSFYSKYKNSEDNATQLVLKLRENHQKHVALFSEVTPDNNIEMKPENRFHSNYMSWLRDRENQNISVESKWKIEQSILHLNNLSEVNNLVIKTLKEEIKSH